MHFISTLKIARNLSLLALALGLGSASSLWAAHPSRGLWVGEVALNAVNEATGAVGDSNTYEFTDPEMTTKTSDTAYLRLILHVNGAGQVSLLKSVALVDTGEEIDGLSEILLITDPKLYPTYAGIAKRIASAFFDFGDPQGTDAVQVLIDRAVSIAVTQALAGELASDIEDTILATLDGIVSNADVDLAYYDPGTGSSFITNEFFSEANVETLADEVAALIAATTHSAVDFNYTNTGVSYNPFSSDPLALTLPDGFNGVVGNAEDLRDRSFYGDTRGIDAIVNIVVAAAIAVDSLDVAATLVEKQDAAKLAAIAEWHNAADLGQAYNRYIAATDFALLADTLLDTAVQAAIDAELLSSDPSIIYDAIETELLNLPPVPALGTAAGNISADSFFGDTRPELALESLIAVASEAATTQVLISTDPITLSDVVETALTAAQEAIQPAPVFASAPSSEYNDFIAGIDETFDYAEAANIAAAGAASEAKFQFGAGVTDADDLAVLTESAVSKALLGYRNQAAALPKYQIALSGQLESGGEVSGSFILPAQSPSNPFLHRLHPDHGSGIEITRRVQLSIDTPAEGADFSSAGYGVSVLTGTYLEEIFGLHKPLGASQDIGLKTQGSFTLNRLTLADTLNF
jgi:hypothetical protein